MKVLDVFVAPAESKSKIRQKRDAIHLVQDYGVEDDKFAGKELDRSVLITPHVAYEIVRDAGIELEYGSLGENIIVDFDIMQLPVGTKLRIGDTELEITQKCTLCSHLAYFGKQVPKLVKDHRGVYCKVLKSGTITKGMDVGVC